MELPRIPQFSDNNYSKPAVPNSAYLQGPQHIPEDSVNIGNMAENLN